MRFLLVEAGQTRRGAMPTCGALMCGWRMKSARWQGEGGHRPAAGDEVVLDAAQGMTYAQLVSDAGEPGSFRGAA